MNNIKRTLSLVMAVIMITLVLPIGEIKGYAVDDVEITSIDFQVVFAKDSGFDKKNAVINIKVYGKENPNSGEIKLIEEGTLPGILLGEEVEIAEGKNIKIFENLPEITRIEPENKVVTKEVLLEGNNLDKIGEDKLSANFINSKTDEEILIEEVDKEIINLKTHIKTNKLEKQFGNWNLEFNESRNIDGIRVNSTLRYEELFTVKEKELGIKLDSITPNQSNIAGVKAIIQGKNILNIDKSHHENREIIDNNRDNDKLTILYKAGKFEENDYKELTREIKFFIDEKQLEISKDTSEDKFEVIIPKCDDTSKLKKDIKVLVRTKIKYEDGSELEFLEKAKITDGFTYTIPEEEKLIITSISHKTIKETGQKDVVIKGKNFKGDMELYLGDKKITVFQVNAAGTEIKFDLPESSKLGIKEIKVKSNTGGVAKIEVEYVKELTTSDFIEGIYIYEKSRDESGDYGKNNRFLINSFDISKASIPTNNLVFKLKTKGKINKEYFDTKISDLKLIRQSDKKTVTISKGKILSGEGIEIGEKGTELENATFQWRNGEVYIYLNESSLKELSYGSQFNEYENRQTAAGKYDVYLNIEGVSKKFKLEHIEDTDKKPYDYLDIKDKPWVERTNPREGDPYYNPNEMYERFTDEDGKKEEGYYIQVEYNNLGGLSLIDKKGVFSGIKVKALGDSKDVVDTSKKLRLKGSTMYIPLQGKLEDGQTYQVDIPANQYVEYPDYDLNTETQTKTAFRNRGYTWKFGTKAIPVVDQIFEGSVVENYDTNYPIILEGSEFTSETTVRFKDSKGDIYRADEVRYWELDDGTKRLYVYLPRSRDRLRVGNYTIIIRNGYDHESEMEYGAFSVVGEGREVPNEDYTIKEDKFFGDIKSMKKKSEYVLELRSSDRNRNYLKIDLDDLMGVDTWSRSLEYSVGYGESIGNLVLESKWADISIANVRLSYDYNERYIKLRAGRAAPGITGSMKAQLIGKTIKSDFIEVQGENFTFDSVTVEIPYRDSEGQNLKLMKYDELSRTFVTVPSMTSTIDGTVTGSSMSSGIFVIVE